MFIFKSNYCNSAELLYRDTGGNYKLMWWKELKKDANTNASALVWELWQSVRCEAALDTVLVWLTRFKSSPEIYDRDDNSNNSLSCNNDYKAATSFISHNSFHMRDVSIPLACDMCDKW